MTVLRVSSKKARAMQASHAARKAAIASGRPRLSIGRVLTWPVTDGLGTVRSGWKILMFMAGCLALVGIGALLWLRAGLKGNPHQLFALASVLCLTTVFLRFEKKEFSWVGFIPKQRVFHRDFLIGGAIGAGMILAITLVLWTTGTWKWAPSESWGSLKFGEKWFYFTNIGGLMLLVALQEELLSRGYPFALLRERIGTEKAVLVTSAIFGLLHIWNPGIYGLVGFVGILNIALAGVVLARLVVVRGNLGAAIGFHASWNIAQVLVGSSVSGNAILAPVTLKVAGWRPHWISGGPIGHEGSIVTTILLLAVIIHFERKR